MTTDDPTDEQIDEMLARTQHITALALADHPRRDRAVEILEHGGSLFCRPVGIGRFQFYVGWFADPRMRPADVDPMEIVPLVTIPRRVMFGSSEGTS